MLRTSDIQGLIKLMDTLDEENWRILQSSRAAIHKTGLTIMAKETNDDGIYTLLYFNQDEWKAGLLNNNKSLRDVDVMKLDLSNQFIEIMNEKIKDNAHYIIPNCREIRERISRYRDSFQR